MKAEWRVFGVFGGFLLLAAAVYAWWTNAATGGVEWAGTVALLFSTALCALSGGYFWLVSRRIEPRPEDRRDATPDEGAGTVGFFSPHSYFPIGIALSAAIAALGIVFWQLWLTGVGLVAALGTTAGLLFEYYTGSRRTE